MSLGPLCPGTGCTAFWRSCAPACLLSTGPRSLVVPAPVPGPASAFARAGPVALSARVGFRGAARGAYFRRRFLLRTPEPVAPRTA